MIWLHFFCEWDKLLLIHQIARKSHASGKANRIKHKPIGIKSTALVKSSAVTNPGGFLWHSSSMVGPIN